MSQLLVRDIGLIDYKNSHELMKAFVHAKKPLQQSEIWLVEHPSILTQGQAGKAAHRFEINSIDCYQSDRGGQITYHGPGQLICYFLCALKALNVNAHGLVHLANQLIVQVLHDFEITGHIDPKNPGVYTQPHNSNLHKAETESSIFPEKLSKIASVGFRIRHQMSYHGIALNVRMDLSGFDGIHPCGLQDQKMSQIADFYPDRQAPSLEDIKKRFVYHLGKFLPQFNVITTNIWPSLQE